jgi:small-conductance mechanosensitive channel
LKTPKIKAEPSPFVLQTSLDDFYVSYQLNAYTMHSASGTAIYSDLHSNIQDTFAAVNVEIMSPHYRVNRETMETTIPNQEADE